MSVKILLLISRFKKKGGGEAGEEEGKEKINMLFPPTLLSLKKHPTLCH